MAKSGIKGDFAKLDRLIARLGQVDRVLTRASKAMADEALELVAEGFAKEQDPYGNDWKELKDPTRGASQKTIRRLKRALAKKQERQRQRVQQQLNAGKAPAIRALKGHRILQDSGRGRKSYHRVRADAKGFKIGPSVNYLGFHQNPKAAGRVARKMVPDPGNLPLRWRMRLLAAAQVALEEHFRGQV